MSNDVRNQDHYAFGIEPIEYMASRFSAEEMRGFYVGNIIKYISRFTRKDGIKDLEKAKNYMEMLIQHEMIMDLPDAER